MSASVRFAWLVDKGKTVVHSCGARGTRPCDRWV